MYEILEISLGDTRRLYQYKQQEIYGTRWSLKEFEYDWILSLRSWKKEEKVLDVGAGYSPLPIHIQQSYGCETWVVDDFGLKSDEPQWSRHGSPQDHMAGHPQVRFVLERLGDPASSSLPANYFDVIYSASALEHVPCGLTPDVWKHMHQLLKPAGELIHAIDLRFPSNGGLRKVLFCLLFDALYRWVPAKIRNRHCFATPYGYLMTTLNALEIAQRPRAKLGVLNMVMNPEVLTESYSIGMNRIVKDQIIDYRYQRVGALLMHFKKSSH